MATLAVSNLSEHSHCGSLVSNPWYLIKSKPCQEMRAQENLERIGAQVVLPLYTPAKSKEKRPFFPGYLFGSFSLSLFAKVNNAFGVRKIVRFGQMPAVVPEAVISELRHRGFDDVLAPDVRFHRGDRIQVVDGPMRGFLGVFDYAISDGERVRILLDTVGRLPVEVGKHDLMLI